MLTINEVFVGFNDIARYLFKFKCNICGKLLRKWTSFTVTAVVPSQAVIVTNKHGSIIKILSNCSNPATLVVRLGTVQGTEVSLNNNILEQYNQITNNGTKDYDGIVYSFANTNKTTSAKNSLFSLKLFARVFNGICRSDPTIWPIAKAVIGVVITFNMVS